MTDRPRKTYTLLQKHVNLIENTKNILKMKDASDSDVLRYILDRYSEQDALQLSKALDHLKDIIGLISRQQIKIREDVTQMFREVTEIDRKSAEFLEIKKMLKDLTRKIENIKITTVTRGEPPPPPPIPKKKNGQIDDSKPEKIEDDDWLSNLGLV